MSLFCTYNEANETKEAKETNESNETNDHRVHYESLEGPCALNIGHGGEIWWQPFPQKVMPKCNCSQMSFSGISVPLSLFKRISMLLKFMALFVHSYTGLSTRSSSSIPISISVSKIRQTLILLVIVSLYKI